MKLEHMRLIVKKHREICDLLLGSLLKPTQSLDNQATDKSRSHAVADKPVPAGMRRIDHLFTKPADDASNLS